MLGMPTVYGEMWATEENANNAMPEPTPDVHPADGMSDGEFNVKFPLPKSVFRQIYPALKLPERIVKQNGLSVRSDAALLLFQYGHG